MTSKEKLVKIYNCEWILKNVIKNDKNFRARIESKNFDIRLGKNATKWTLKVIFNYESNSLELFLHKKRVTRDNFLITFNVQINEDEFQWEKKAEEIVFGSWGWPCLIKLEHLFDGSKGYVDRNKRLKLNIIVKLTELDDSQSEFNNSVLSNQCSKCDTCAYYFENKSYSDFILRCSDNVSIPVHRSFLAKKSPVFKNFFDNEKHEQSQTLLEDIDSETMNEVLRFIYCGNVEIDDVKLYTSVLHAAATYDIVELITLCIDGLMEKVNKENAMEILKIAYDYGHSELERNCLSVILKYYKELKDTEQFMELKLPLIMKIMDAAIDTSTHLSYQSLN